MGRTLHDRSQDEESCLVGIAAGEDAWHEFWDLYGWIIETEVNRYYGDSTDCLNDIYHNIVLKLLHRNCHVIRQHLKRSRRGDFGALVRKITRNVLIDLWRKQQRQRTLRLIDTDMHRVENQGTSDEPGHGFLWERYLTRTFLKLTRGRNDAMLLLTLRFIDGESVNYIADRLAMKEDTVRHRIQYYVNKMRAEHREALREFIND